MIGLDHLHGALGGRQLELHGAAHVVHAGSGHHGQGLGAGGHDAAHVGDALLGHALAGAQHHRQGHLQYFDATGHIAFHGRCAGADLQLAGQRHVGQVQEFGHHGAHLAAVVVDGLLAGQDQVEAFVPGIGRHLFGHLQGLCGLHIHAHRLIRADRQALADGGIGIGTAHGDGGDGPGTGGLLQFEGTHQGIPLIVGVHDEGDAVPIELGAVIGESDACRGVGHLAEKDEDLHVLGEQGSGSICSGALPGSRPAKGAQTYGASQHLGRVWIGGGPFATNPGPSPLRLPY